MIWFCPSSYGWTQVVGKAQKKHKNRQRRYPRPKPTSPPPVQQLIPSPNHFFKMTFPPLLLALLPPRGRTEWPTTHGHVLVTWCLTYCTSQCCIIFGSQLWVTQGFPCFVNAIKIVFGLFTSTLRGFRVKLVWMKLEYLKWKKI